MMSMFGGKRAPKRGRGTAGKKPVLVAFEAFNKGAGFVGMQELILFSKEKVRTYAFQALNDMAVSHFHDKKRSYPDEASQRLPLVHIMIVTSKKFINGTFHGVSPRHLQEYFDELCYLLNRIFWEPGLPLRLLNACLNHVPIKNC